MAHSCIIADAVYWYTADPWLQLCTVLPDLLRDIAKRNGGHRNGDTLWTRGDN